MRELEQWIDSIGTKCGFFLAIALAQKDSPPRLKYLLKCRVPITA